MYVFGAGLELFYNVKLIVLFVSPLQSRFPRPSPKGRYSVEPLRGLATIGHVSQFTLARRDRSTAGGHGEACVHQKEEGHRPRRRGRA